METAEAMEPGMEAAAEAMETAVQAATAEVTESAIAAAVPEAVMAMVIAAGTEDIMAVEEGAAVSMGKWRMLY